MYLGAWGPPLPSASHRSVHQPCAEGKAGTREQGSAGRTGPALLEKAPSWSGEPRAPGLAATSIYALHIKQALD